MTTTLERAIDKIRERASDDPEFAEAVVQFASDEVTDPFAPVAPAVVEVARELDRQRQRTRADELRAESLSTVQVVELLASVNDRKGVDRRRKRGTLLGIRAGRDTFHPQWQFDRRRRETWAGLADVLAALRAVTADDLDAHAIAIAPDATVDGRSIAQLLASGDVEAAVQAAHLAGDQS
jgi:hypothetical protein